MPLSPNYNPKGNEAQIYKQWMAAKIGCSYSQRVEATPTLPQIKTHSILMPPPNLTGDLHAGHAFQHYLMDTLSRLARQRGEKNLWLPGVDHAGLQLEGVIDKLIKKGEFDEIIKKYKLKDSPLEGWQSQTDGVVRSDKETEIANDDLPKYLKTNYPDLWLECAWSKVNLWRDNQKNQSAVLGDTPDYDKTLFTLDPQNIEMVNYAFIKYWQDGLIYKGSYLVNWSVGLQTALSDVAGEIEYEKRIDPFVTFEYRLFEKNEIKNSPTDTVILSVAKDPLILDSKFQPLNKSILVGTVRPETIFGDYAVAVHPDIFERDYNEFKDLIDEKKLFVQLPLTDKMIPVILANEVDPNFGSGALKITPANDQVDYDIFNKYLGGEFEGAIGRDGKLTHICGEFAGQTVNGGRANVIKALIKNGFVPKNKVQEISERKEAKGYFGIEFDDDINPEDYQIDWNYSHNVTICERTKTVVEPLISEEFFISYHKEFAWNPISKNDNVSIANRGKKTNLQKLGIEAVNKTNFYSEDYKARGINFLENIKDWCISRDLIWGHKMPVWYNLETNPERKFYSFAEVSSNSPYIGGGNEVDGGSSSNKHFAISPTKPTTPGNWIQEEKILDTWFSSCLWPLSTLKYTEFVENKKDKTNVILIGGGEVFETKEQYLEWLKSPESNFSFFKSNYNNNNKNWKYILKSIFNAENIQFIEPIMPSKTNAQYEDWKMTFEKILPFINPNSILIGYSLGSLFLTKYLAENKVAYKLLFLLAGGLEKNNNTFKTPDNLDFINNTSTFVLHSANDSIVPFSSSEELTQKLTVTKRYQPYLGDMDHFFGPCDDLVDYISSKIKQKIGEIQTITDFETFYPTQEMTTGKDIFYQWIVRMTTLSYYFTAQIPYTDLVITPTILDDKGKKMSKSLGNGMDPVAQIDKYSSDAMRMAMLGGMIPDRNIKMGGRLADELCEKYRNFGNKMWNIARFFEYQEEKIKEVK